MNIEREQLDALVDAAARGDVPATVEIYESVLAANGVKRYFLMIRWHNTGGAPTYRSTTWPPAFETHLLKQDRPIERADVDTILLALAVSPADVHVTSDVAGVVGWTAIGDFTFL